jgi:hypothetical protein
VTLNNATIVPIPGKGIVEVTFALKNGRSRTYTYSGDAAAKILVGADPALFTYDSVS